MIDITDYGAVGDGATDSTEAVRAALDAAAAAGGTVLVPEGRFSVRGLAVPNGVRGIHVYTMNKPDVAKAIADNLSHLIAGDGKN